MMKRCNRMKLDKYGNVPLFDQLDMSWADIWKISNLLNVYLKFIYLEYDKSNVWLWHILIRHCSQKSQLS